MPTASASSANCAISDNLNAVLVKDNLTRDQMDVIAVHSLDLPGTDIDMGEVRLILMARPLAFARLCRHCVHKTPR